MATSNVFDFWDKINSLKSAILKEYTRIRIQKSKMKSFELEWNEFNRLANEEAQAKREHWHPFLYDKLENTEIEPVYFYQDAWAFERIINEKPKEHLDIGSHHKFVALLSKTVSLSMIDIRPLSLKLDSIKFIRGNLLDLPFDNETVDSLSSLCVIEHIGLGRYGDKLDPKGSEKAFYEIARVISPGGNFYFSVPIEEISTTYFNAHRSFTETDLFEKYLYQFDVLDSKYIQGNNFMDEKPFGFSIGCYHLKKRV